ncbi:HD domain-containing protein [Virgibacillus salexigens]|uniref:Phosphohydrolase n=1 Tax=Virgibacillus kapii TaxID=1638645 RepID=A0ABQ2D4R5_9BACI|nr:HD domain-containing protein [Virgibacillus kapii]GGJ46213.1 phosphohydrolase [Virgibacillus kapii]
MEELSQLIEIQKLIRNLFSDDYTGHDFFHMERVATTAGKIAKIEDADLFICEAAAWLHDVGDAKLFTDPEETIKELDLFLQRIAMNEYQINKVKEAIQDVSFSKGGNPTTLEGKIVQDADRLDAIGAIGIARAFAYGGANRNYINHDTNKNNTIQHFYDKLLKIKELLHTEAAKKIADERHRFMEVYLLQFEKEWSKTKSC